MRPVVYLAVGPVDLRGAFDKLAALTRQVLVQTRAAERCFSSSTGAKTVSRLSGGIRTAM